MHRFPFAAVQVLRRRCVGERIELRRRDAPFVSRGMTRTAAPRSSAIEATSSNSGLDPAVRRRTPRRARSFPGRRSSTADDDESPCAGRESEALPARICRGAEHPPARRRGSIGRGR
jgi:hypothetical protein